ncbi:MAG: hypothetical protein ACTHKB_13150 [Burkholderiaceae bacterium]
MPSGPRGVRVSPNPASATGKAGGSADKRRIEAGSILETRFPWVLQKIQLMWGYPELDAYLHTLTMDERGGRQGFPPEAWEEIHLLVAIHRHFTTGGYW